MPNHRDVQSLLAVSHSWIGEVYPSDSASRSKRHCSIVCAGPSTANAPINPSWGSRLNKLHRVAALGSVLTSCNVAGASGSIETENSDKGNDSQSPQALINASLRVQQAKKARASWFDGRDRKSTRLNSSHQITSYAVFCLKKKNTRIEDRRRIS